MAYILGGDGTDLVIKIVVVGGSRKGASGEAEGQQSSGGVFHLAGKFLESLEMRREVLKQMIRRLKLLFFLLLEMRL